MIRELVVTIRYNPTHDIMKLNCPRFRYELPTRGHNHFVLCFACSMMRKCMPTMNIFCRLFVAKWTNVHESALSAPFTTCSS